MSNDSSDHLTSLLTILTAAILRLFNLHFLLQESGDRAGPSDDQNNPRNRMPIFQPRTLWAVSGIVVIHCALLCVGYFADPGRPSEYRTDIGQRKTVHLWDGSQIALNTKSHLLVQSARGAFRLQLLEGEAVFTFPHNPSRTITVIAKRAIVKDVGTQFSVRIDPDRTVVSVASGTVLLSATQSPEAVSESAQKESGAVTRVVDVPLRDGERATLSGPPSEIELRQERIPVSQLMRDWAWRQGWILLSNVPLEVAVAEFNRYNQTQVVVSDPAIGSKRFDISVRTTDLNSFVDSLAKHGVEAREGSAPGTIALVGKHRTK